MFCQICHEKIVEERTLWHLFKPSVHSICERCYQKYPLYPRTKEYPIKGYLMIHTCLSVVKYKYQGNCYQSFIAPYINAFLKLNKKSIFLYFECMDLNIYELLDSLELGNLIIVTLYENMG
jgi:hypothetical protein